MTSIPFVTQATAAKDPSKYVWFKFTGKRSSAKMEDGTKIPIVEGERFGVKVYKGDVHVLLKSDLTKKS